MKRTYKYKNHVSEWYDVDVGDVLVLKGKDGSVFDIVVIMKNNKEAPCAKCPLSKDGVPGECMHYAFACSSNMTAISVDSVLENL